MRLICAVKASDLKKQTCSGRATCSRGDGNLAIATHLEIIVLVASSSASEHNTPVITFGFYHLFVGIKGDEMNEKVTAVTRMYFLALSDACTSGFFDHLLVRIITFTILCEVTRRTILSQHLCHLLKGDRFYEKVIAPQISQSK